jgi:hypothetical protein
MPLNFWRAVRPDFQALIFFLNLVMIPKGGTSMKHRTAKIIFITGTFFLILSLTSTVFAARGGGGGGLSAGSSIGGGFVLTTPSQNDVNTLIDNANTNAGGISTKNLGAAIELYGHYSYRFSGSMFELQFRPSYFSQSSTGSGTGGNYDYKLTGFTFFPILRLYPLESSFIKFFLQAGLGYGRLSGSITEASANVDFAGGAFGAIGGLGAEFCFTPNHCVVIEGNMRYLPIDRNIVSSSSGTFSSPNSLITQYGSEQELEFSNQDLKTTMSGIQGILAYTYHF